VDQISLKAYYEEREPAPQNVVDLFKGSWKSLLPGGLASGTKAMFEDRRPAWLAAQLPGGLALKTVIEFGPFEGYQTYLMLREGAREVTSVEANSINFLKCLCLKEIYRLKANFLFGDIVKFLEKCERRYDVAWASGMLYHLQDPIYFIQRVSQIADYVYVWTHHFDAEAIGGLHNGQEKCFVADFDKVGCHHGRKIVLHARSYLLPDYKESIPLYWEGGLEQVTYWLTKEDLLWLFEQAGMHVLAVQGEGDVVGLPCIGFIVGRS
jgi:hypothetical protein